MVSVVQPVEEDLVHIGVAVLIIFLVDNLIYWKLLYFSLSWGKGSLRLWLSAYVCGLHESSFLAHVPFQSKDLIYSV